MAAHAINWHALDDLHYARPTAEFGVDVMRCLCADGPNLCRESSEKNMKKLVMLLSLSLALVASACSDESTNGGSGGDPGSGGSGGIVGGVNKVIPIVCTNDVSPQLSDLGVDATIATSPASIVANQDFDATMGGNMAFDQAFLQAAVVFIPGLEDVLVDLALATFSASNATNPDPLGSARVTEETFPIPQVPNPGHPNGGGACTEDADCPWAFLDQTCDMGSSTCNPAPAVDCTTAEDCPEYELAPDALVGCGNAVAGECDPVVCDLDDPGGTTPCGFDFDCPFAADGQTCSTNDGGAGTCNAFAANVCFPLVTGPIVIPLTPGTHTYTAGASGDVCFDIAGDVTADPSATRVNATVLALIPVKVNCEAGTIDPDAPDETNDPMYIVPNTMDALICFTIGQ